MEKIKNFFNKWYRRFKIFVFLFSTWAVIFSVNNIMNNSVAIEYDDGLIYSGDVFREIEKEKVKITDESYWEKINVNYKLERIKPIPFVITYFLKIIGIKIDIIADRGNDGGDYIRRKWQNFSRNLYFVKEQEEKYNILKKNGYLLFFASSDEGIVQAKKSGIYPVRIKRNSKSVSTLSYTPGRYKEKIIPLSEF